jgi:hypothetical protein
MAKKKPTDPIDPAKADAYYEALRTSKIAAGLRAEDAAAVTAIQRSEDEASGTQPWVSEEIEEAPEA